MQAAGMRWRLSPAGGPECIMLPLVEPRRPHTNCREASIEIAYLTGVPDDDGTIGHTSALWQGEPCRGFIDRIASGIP